MMPGFADDENIRFRPSGDVFTQPTRLRRYQFTSAGLRVSKLYWMSHHGSTPAFAESVHQLSASVTRYGWPPAGTNAAGNGLMGFFVVSISTALSRKVCANPQRRYAEAV